MHSSVAYVSEIESDHQSRQNPFHRLECTHFRNPRKSFGWIRPPLRNYAGKQKFLDKSSKYPTVRSQRSAQLVGFGLAQFYATATKLPRGMRPHAQIAQYRSQKIFCVGEP
jgi:hypothetical protein